MSESEITRLEKRLDEFFRFWRWAGGTFGLAIILAIGWGYAANERIRALEERDRMTSDIASRVLVLESSERARWEWQTRIEEKLDRLIEQRFGRRSTPQQ